MASHDRTLLTSSHFKLSRPFFSTLARLNFPLKHPLSKYSEHCISAGEVLYFCTFPPEEDGYVSDFGLPERTTLHGRQPPPKEE